MKPSKLWSIFALLQALIFIQSCSTSKKITNSGEDGGDTFREVGRPQNGYDFIKDLKKSMSNHLQMPKERHKSRSHSLQTEETVPLESPRFAVHIIPQRQQEMSSRNYLKTLKDQMEAVLKKLSDYYSVYSRDDDIIQTIFNNYIMEINDVLDIDQETVNKLKAQGISHLVLIDSVTSRYVRVKIFDVASLEIAFTGITTAEFMHDPFIYVRIETDVEWAELSIDEDSKYRIPSVIKLLPGDYLLTLTHENRQTVQDYLVLDGSKKDVMVNLNFNKKRKHSCLGF